MSDWHRHKTASYWASLLCSLFVCCGILTARFAGWLEFLELSTYDLALTLRAPNIANHHIVLITITEEDIKTHGYPVSDAILAQALSTLMQYQPRAIGLELYRDIPVAPGSDKLETVLSTHRHIIVTAKFGRDGRRIAPPTAATESQVGFGDALVQDDDGHVRRALLSMNVDENIAYAFAFRLAHLFFQAEWQVPSHDPANPLPTRLGNVTIQPFEANDGGYIGADAGGYQLLLDFRDASDSFSSYSLSALLSNQIPMEVIKDRVVLIGMTAESVVDVFSTPYSRWRKGDKEISGLVFQAYVVSQLLRIGREESPLITVWYEWQEILWILGWSIIGGLVGLWASMLWLFALMGFGCLAALVCAIYVALRYSWWIPDVPAVLGWLIAVTIVSIHVRSWERRRPEGEGNQIWKSSKIMAFSLAGGVILTVLIIVLFIEGAPKKEVISVAATILAALMPELFR